MRRHRKHFILLLSVLAAPLLFGCSDDPVSPENRIIGPRLSVTPASAVIHVGESVKLTALARNDDGDLVSSGQSPKWVSSDPEIAEVDEEGFVLAQSTGQVVISAECNGNCAWAEILVVAEGDPIHW